MFNNVLYILTMLEAIEKSFIYTQKFINADDFFRTDDQLYFNATVNLLIAIGEESKKIDNEMKSRHDEVNWKLLAGLRDKISHNYRGIDPTIIWNIIKNDLTVLKKSLISLLQDTTIDSTLLHTIVQTDYYKHLTYLLNDTPLD